MEDIDFKICYVERQMFDQNNDFSNTLEANLDLVVTKTAEVIFDAIDEFFDP